MSHNKTVSEIAEQTGRNPVWLRRVCLRNGWGQNKNGRVRLIDENEEKAILKYLVNAKPGRPKKAAKKKSKQAVDKK